MHNKTSIVMAFLFIVLHMTATGDAGDRQSQGNKDVTIGLTLSGGGARGLAHIGVLHVIDSLGIKIDYISGTSMGSIVGGMYAAGYSAREIEDFALGMNWEAMFTRNTDLSYIHPVWRNDHNKNIIELPIEYGRLRLPTGAIEGQQLWNTLNELFFHVHDIVDFNQLGIPFACVATNVENGEPVVMKGGNLVSAIRASMAIPSVFTVVDREGHRLIDGGVVNNFPVMVAKEMGAGYVIGVNVSQGLRPAEDLKTPIDIIYQMGFYSDARSFGKNREATDLFIEPDLEGYTAASFASTYQIIEQGKIAARKHVDEFVALKRAGQQEPEPTGGSQREEIRLVIDSIQIRGLENVRTWFARSTMKISPGDSISASILTSAVNRLYATNYFDRVHYSLHVCETTDMTILQLDVTEKPFASLSGSLHFSSFTGVGLIAGAKTNKFFEYNSHASASVLLGEKPAFKTNLTYFISDSRNTWLQWTAHGRYLTFPLFENFEAISEYKQSYFRTGISYNQLAGENGYYSLGLGYYYQSLAPNMRSPVIIDGNTSALETRLEWVFNSLDNNAFPASGQKFNMEAAFIFNQSPSFKKISVNGEEIELEDLGIHIRNFFQTHINYKHFFRIRDRLTQFSQVQFGYNFLYEQGFINSFNVGGTHPFLERQVTFIGLNEYELICQSVVAAAHGYRYHLDRGIYLSATANLALFDFRFSEPEKLSRDQLVFGAGLSLGYDGLLGPFEITFSHSPQTGKLSAYLNLGWAF